MRGSHAHLDELLVHSTAGRDPEDRDFSRHAAGLSKPAPAARAGARAVVPISVTGGVPPPVHGPAAGPGCAGDPVQARGWLAAIPAGSEFIPLPVEPKGGLDEIRNDIEVTKDELNRLETAPVPSDDLGERLRDYVFGMAGPMIGGVGTGQQLWIRWPTHLHATEQNGGYAPGGRADPLALIAWLFRDQMVERLVADVQEAVERTAPLAERPKLIADLRLHLRDLERMEEALIEQAHARGHNHVTRHFDAAVPAVLGIAIKLPEDKEVVAPATRPERKTA